MCTTLKILVPSSHREGSTHAQIISPLTCLPPFNLFPTKRQSDPFGHVQSCHSSDRINSSLRINSEVLITADKTPVGPGPPLPFCSHLLSVFRSPHFSLIGLQVVPISTRLSACDNLTSDFHMVYYSLMFFKSLLKHSLHNEAIPLIFHPPHTLFFSIALITS